MGSYSMDFLQLKITTVTANAVIKRQTDRFMDLDFLANKKEI